MMNRKNNSVRPLPRGGQGGASEKYGPWVRQSLWRRAAAIMLGLTVVLSIGVTPAYAFTIPAYLPAVNYGTGLYTYAIANGDFNNDGRLDLAVANRNGYSVSVLLNNGSGAYLPAIDYAFAGSPFDIVAADFDGDGYDDLASIGSGKASILIAKNNGTFNPAIDYEAGTYLYNVVSGDFNGDHRPDLAVSNQPGSISVLLNNGDGTFAAKVDYAVGSNSKYMTTGDFNNDGYDDLAIENNSPLESGDAFYIKQISVLYGVGNGTFGAAQTAFNFRSLKGVEGSDLWQSEITSLVSGDFDGDGYDDMAMVGANSLDFEGHVMILRSTGDGSFTRSQSNIGESAWGLSVGDINSDGKLDLAAATQGNGTVTFLRGGGDCSFVVGGAFYVGIRPMDMTIGDFNGDGRPDLAAAGYIGMAGGPGEVSVLINDNGDHRLFVVTNNASGGSASGTGSFSEGASVQVTATANEGYYFTGWTDAAGNALSADASYSYTMPAGNTAIVATFARAPMFPAVVIVNDHSFSVTVCNTYGALDESFSTAYGSITGTASGNDTVLTGTLTGVPDTWTEITLNGIKLKIRAAALPDTTVTNPSFY